MQFSDIGTSTQPLTGGGGGCITWDLSVGFSPHTPPLAPSLLTHFLTHYCVLLMQLRTNLCMYVYVCIAHRNIINLY